MRKILISIVFCLLLIGSAFFVVNGMSKIKVAGFTGIDEKDQEVESKNTELSNIISITYANTESNLKKTANTLIDSKTEYENQAMLSSSNKSSYAAQLETYDIDYLWTKLGNYAKDEGVVIKIELTSSGASSNLYNLNFTASGSYVGITNFIYDIENDSRLGFKIDEFKMTASDNGNSITATFTCKEIPVKVGTIEARTTDQANTDANSSNNNTTNSVDSNTTSDTTNTTNTSSSTSNVTTTNTSTDYLNSTNY